MEKQIAKIARDVLGLDTLETRKSDGLDFHDLAVWKIREALADAYLAGMGDSQRLVGRVARLNPAAGEIGAGMLASLVEDARRLGVVDKPTPVAWRYRNSLGEIVSEWIDGQPNEYHKQQVADFGGSIDYAFAR